MFVVSSYLKFITLILKHDFLLYILLSDYHFGFRPKHSTEHVGLQFHDYIIHQLDEGNLHLVYSLICRVLQQTINIIM